MNSEPTVSFKYPPAAFFGMILGLVGLGADWRSASKIWHMPSWVGEAIMALACMVWLVLATLYLAKWLRRRLEAVKELDDPIQCCFVGLFPVSTILIGLALAPYSRPAGITFSGIGICTSLAFSVWRQGGLWRGGREIAATTPVLYLPAVAGNFVAAAAAASFGFIELGELFFGAGLFTWLAVESVILQRLFNGESLPVRLRPTLGIQLAPPVVGLVAYLNISDGQPGLAAHALLGYGLLQALILIRLLPWIAEQTFSASYWAVTFGVSALALGAERLVERGADGLIEDLAAVLFALSNIIILAILAGTIVLLVRGTLIPSAPAPISAQPKPSGS